MLPRRDEGRQLPHDRDLVSDGADRVRRRSAAGMTTTELTAAGQRAQAAEVRSPADGRGDRHGDRRDGAGLHGRLRAGAGPEAHASGDQRALDPGDRRRRSSWRSAPPGSCAPRLRRRRADPPLRALHADDGRRAAPHPASRCGSRACPRSGSGARSRSRSARSRSRSSSARRCGSRGSRSSRRGRRSSRWRPGSRRPATCSSPASACWSSSSSCTWSSTRRRSRSSASPAARSRESHGVIGQLDFELVHFIADTTLWISLGALAIKFKGRNAWLWVAFGAAALHQVEHFYLFYSTSSTRRCTCRAAPPGSWATTA